jgi:hypothetical protein
MACRSYDFYENPSLSYTPEQSSILLLTFKQLKAGFRIHVLIIYML